MSYKELPHAYKLRKASEQANELESEIQWNNLVESLINNSIEGLYIHVIGGPVELKEGIKAKLEDKGYEVKFDGNNTIISWEDAEVEDFTQEEIDAAFSDKN
jgi:hypothetical protein